MVKVPKYYQVKNEILALMADLAPGAAVPTERELAERFETSRTTVRQAIAELVVDGRLEREHRSKPLSRVRPAASAPRAGLADRGMIAPCAARISSCSRAMTTWPWASTRWAGRAASRSAPTSRPASAPISRMPASRRGGTRRWRSTTASTPCTPRSSRTRRPAPPNMRCRASGTASRRASAFPCRRRAKPALPWYP